MRVASSDRVLGIPGLRIVHMRDRDIVGFRPTSHMRRGCRQDPPFVASVPFYLSHDKTFDNMSSHL